jgi:hypothetical protein
MIVEEFITTTPASPGPAEPIRRDTPWGEQPASEHDEDFGADDDDESM